MRRQEKEKEEMRRQEKEKEEMRRQEKEKKQRREVENSLRLASLAGPPASACFSPHATSSLASLSMFDSNISISSRA
jgi:hypothetical protein